MQPQLTIYKPINLHLNQTLDLDLQIPQQFSNLKSNQFLVGWMQILKVEFEETLVSCNLAASPSDGFKATHSIPLTDTCNQAKLYNLYCFSIVFSKLYFSKLDHLDHSLSDGFVDERNHDFIFIVLFFDDEHPNTEDESKPSRWSCHQSYFQN